MYILGGKGLINQNVIYHISAHYRKAVALSVLSLSSPQGTSVDIFLCSPPPSDETLMLDVHPLFVHVSLCLYRRSESLCPPKANFHSLGRAVASTVMHVAQSPVLGPQLQVYNVHRSITAGTGDNRQFSPSTSSQFVFPG